MMIDNTHPDGLYAANPYAIAHELVRVALESPYFRHPGGGRWVQLWAVDPAQRKRLDPAFAGPDDCFG
jgi:hypothetical protein